MLTPNRFGVLGPAPTGGTASCSGAASLPLPLPPVSALAGLTLAGQAILLRASPLGYGTDLSECAAFTLQGN
ncbi:MAG: hypothetical protein KDC98_23975 [Planctomycetes bacterium]|nr:hypothetical protein [Planctomycetota bacterium]